MVKKKLNKDKKTKFFSYHNYSHPTSLAFYLFWVSHYCMYCLFIYL